MSLLFKGLAICSVAGVLTGGAAWFAVTVMCATLAITYEINEGMV
jgi:hypothetical protein